MQLSQAVVELCADMQVHSLQFDLIQLIKGTERPKHQRMTLKY